MIAPRLCRLIVSLSICLLSLASQAVAADSKREPKRVLLLYYSFGANLVNAKSIRTELDLATEDLLEIYEAPFARAADESAMDRYAEYLAALFPDKKLDLVVAVGGPAIILFQRNRQRLFPSAKLLALAEVRRIPPVALTSNDVIFASTIDLAGLVRNIMQVLPETTNLEVVVGNSPSERDWFEQVRVAFEPFKDRASLHGTNDLSFDEMLTNVAALPPRSAILFLLFLTDSAGQTHEDTAVLTKLHRVANAPIFSFYDGGFGQGIVGGPLISVQERGRRIADAAFRILHGEAPGSIKPKIVTASASKYDWRELQRWGIDESRLPPKSEIHFRPPSAWEQYRIHILAVIAVLLMQAGLISWLFYEHRRRHHAEILVHNTMSELTHLNRVATAGQLTGSIAHEVSQPLTAMISNANAALRWLGAKAPDIEEARAALMQIVSSGHRASDVIQHVRSMFNKDAGERRSVNINQLIMTVLEITKVDLQKHDIEVHADLGTSLPALTGNPVQLQQVILNLVINAAEAMTSVSYRALHVRSDQSKPTLLHISIEDTGKGISPSNIDHVFEPLFSTKERGMGMGLSICRSIIESHQGRIWVSDSALGGSNFQFEIPVNR